MFRLQDFDKISIFINTSSHWRCSVKKVFFKKFVKFTGKHLCQSLFFNKVAGLGPETLLKKTLWQRCFPVHFAEFSRTPPGDCFYIKRDLGLKGERIDSFTPSSFSLSFFTELCLK